MPVTEIACPNCGAVFRANYLEVPGQVPTPCRECNDLVWVATDEQGYIEAIFADSEKAQEKVIEARRPSVWPLLLGLLLLGLIGFAVASRGCAPTVPVSRETTAETATPTPFPSASPPLEVTVLEQLNKVEFEFDKAVLTEASKTLLSDNAQFIKDTPAGTVYEISGHTDDVGSAEYNKNLSLARARAAQDFLLGLGVPKAKVNVKAYGLTQPMDTNETEEGRARNRRVEFKMVRGNGEVVSGRAQQ